MYQQFYGLNALPFELTATPGCLFSSPGHREALSNLVYGLSTAKAITLLTGEAGTGKTTLIQAAIGSKRCKHVSCVYLHNPALTRTEFFEMLARQFGLDPSLATSKTALLATLEAALLNARARGRAVALVVDEAQCLSHELLEEIRLLANFEINSQRLIPVVLAGQPELGDRLNEPQLRQLKQRIALRCSVEPFTLPETAAYMSTRIKFAGGEGARLFTREAVVLVHERSRGIARTINVICDNALLTGMALERRPVGHEVVLEVCEDFDLRRSNDMPGADRVGAGVRREETATVEPAAPAVRVNAATRAR
jgi:general secretion pathway protein A